jgi:flagellar assembly protein FliH
LTNVYKSQSFISKNERVRIPDVDYENISNDRELHEETYDESASSEDAANETAFAEETFSEQSGKEEPGISDIKKHEEKSSSHAAILSRDELYELYEQNLKELANSVAQQAYYDALNKKKAELKDCISEVQNLMDELVMAHRQFIDEYTNELKYMAVDIAEKMILEKIGEDDTILQRLVLQTVNSVKNAEWLNVEVSERLVGLVDQIKKELEKPEYNGRAFVFPVAGSDSVCRVTTNEGTIVSTIEVQAENLRKAFREFEQQYPR